jgi:F-type H+-transporting ATPase subunit k
MAVLGSIFAGSYLAMSGGSKPKTAAGPPINASSKEEGDFIQYVPQSWTNWSTIMRQWTNRTDGCIRMCIANKTTNRNFLKEVDGGDKKSEKH